MTSGRKSWALRRMTTMADSFDDFLEHVDDLVEKASGFLAVVDRLEKILLDST